MLQHALVTLQYVSNSFSLPHLVIVKFSSGHYLNCISRDQPWTSKKAPWSAEILGSGEKVCFNIYRIGFSTSIKIKNKDNSAQD